MSNKTLNVRQKQKYDISENWTSNNPILLAGEIGIESDTNKMKVGNGVNGWNDLPYFIDLSNKANLIGDNDFKGTQTISNQESDNSNSSIMINSKNIMFNNNDKGVTRTLAISSKLISALASSGGFSFLFNAVEQANMTENGFDFKKDPTINSDPIAKIYKLTGNVSTFNVSRWTINLGTDTYTGNMIITANRNYYNTPKETEPTVKMFNRGYGESLQTTHYLNFSSTYPSECLRIGNLYKVDNYYCVDIESLNNNPSVLEVSIMLQKGSIKPSISDAIELSSASLPVPAYSWVDLNSNQSIGGQKVFTEWIVNKTKPPLNTVNVWGDNYSTIITNCESNAENAPVTDSGVLISKLASKNYGCQMFIANDENCTTWRRNYRIGFRAWQQMEQIVEKGENYIKYASGLQICWGSDTVGANTSKQTTLPKPFLTTSSFKVFTQDTTYSNNGQWQGLQKCVINSTTTFTQYNAYDSSCTYSYFAVGFWR